MNKINDMIQNAPEEIMESNNIQETRYTFVDVKDSLREFIKQYKHLGYYTYFDFPNLFRIGRGGSHAIAGEFTPTYVRIVSADLKELLLTYPKTKRFKNYFLSEVRLKKVE